ncbi:MAG: hypothetical protein IPK80_30205 [Nannocystis sp.]|nr:hypothetical protein [Nannocystis sp.]
MHATNHNTQRPTEQAKLMILRIENTHPINLSAGIDGAGGLVVSHGANDLSGYDYLFNELPEQGYGPHDEAEIVVADFIHGGDTHQVYVWEALPSGGVQQWTRQSGASLSGPRDDLDVTELLIVAVPPGVTVPSPTSTDGPPAAGTTQSAVKVKITKAGGMPFK